MNRQTSSLRWMLSRAVRCFLVLCWCVSIAVGAVRHGIFIQESRSVSLAQSGIARISANPSSDRIVLLTSDNFLRVFKTSTLAEQPALLGAEKKISAIDFSSDGHSFIAGTADGKIYSWDLTVGILTKSFEVVSVPIIGLEALKGSQVLVTASDGNLEVRDWTSGDRITSLSQINDEITCQVLHPNGKWVAFGTSSGRVHVYDLAQSQDVKVIPTTGGKITAVGVSPDGRLLATGSSDGSVRMWDGGRLILRNNLTGQHGDITSLAVDPKNRWLVSAAMDSTVRIYNIFTGELLKTITESNGYYSYVSFLNDKTLCGGISNGLLKTLLVLDAPPDSLPPTIVISRPLIDVHTYAAKVHEKEFMLEGVAYDDSAVAKVTVNGNPIQLFNLDPSDTLRFPPGVRTKGFKTPVKTDSLGITQVEVKAFDGCENVSVLNLNVQRLPADQIIEIIASMDSGNVEKIAMRLKFKLWIEAVSFSVSDNLLEIFSNHDMKNKVPGELISVDVPLVVGYNQIQITAAGKFGEKFSKTVGINRKMGFVRPIGPDLVQQGQANKGGINQAAGRGIGMQRWAVVVGVSRYASSDIAQLNYADADAKEFAEFLQTQQGGSFENDHMQVLLNQDATLANVRNALYNFASQAIDSDLVVIYFAGHGAPNPLKPDQLYLLTYDSDPNIIRTTAFPMWDISTVLEKYIQARKVVVITDACHSGGISTELSTRGLANAKSNPINQYLANLAKAKDGVVIFTASAQNEVSQENAEFRHGVFTHFLLEGLRGKADRDNNNVVTINELMGYVEENVKRFTKGYQNPMRSQTDYDKELPMSIVQP